jgi:hypothetical protein
MAFDDGARDAAVEVEVADAVLALCALVVAIPEAALLLSLLTRSSGVAPATNWPAIDVTLAFTGPATSAGASEAAASPVFIAGLSSTALSPRYSRRWRTISADELSVGSTSTNRKSWALNAGSLIDHSMMRA